MIKEEFLLDRLSENPEFKLEDLDQKTLTSDEEWVRKQEFEHTNETLKKVFEGKIEEPKKPSKESEQIKASGLNPIEMARLKAKVRMKSKFEKPISVPEPLGGNDEEFEEVYREIN